MNEDKWEVIKSKFERTLQNWEIDKKCNQFTLDSIHSLFPTEIETIINYIEQLQQELTKILQEVGIIQHNLEKYEEIGTWEHFDYALHKSWELHNYLFNLINGDKEK